MVSLAFCFFVAGASLKFSNGVRIRNSNILTTSVRSSRAVAPIGNNWIATLGDGITTKGVEIALLSGGLRGIVASEDIASNSVSATVPADLAIETNNNRPPSPFPEFCSQTLWSENCKWDNRLALMLLHELKVLGDKSKKIGWLEQLPKSFSTPLHWDSKEIDATQYEALAKSVDRQEKGWRAFYDKWQADAVASQEVKKIAFEDFVWAMECVNSRAFSGAYEGSSAAERRSLFIFTGALTLLWPLLGLGTSEQALGAAVLVGISIVIRDVIFSKAAGLKRYVVCPYIDMFNHKSTCTADVSYGYFSNSFELRTQGYQKGEQVFISYGKQSNDRLLQYYGFVDTENPYDSYDFGVGFLDLIIKYADEIAADVAVPSTPSPRERLQVVAAALSATEVEETSLSNTAAGGAGAGAKKKVAQSTTGDEFNTRYFRIARSALAAAAVAKGGDNSGAAVSQGATNYGGPLRVLDHFDDLTVRAMRALYSSPEEWATIAREAAGGQLQTLETLGRPLSSATESKIATALQSIARLELEGKSTTIEEDLKALNEIKAQQQQQQSKKSTSGSGSLTASVSTSTTSRGFGAGEAATSTTLAAGKKSGKEEVAVVDPSGRFNDADFAALSFRLEKKRLLKEALSK